MRQVRQWKAVAGAALLVGACAGPGGTSSANGTASESTESRGHDAAPGVVVVRVYEEDRLLHNAEQELIRRCMAEAGFEFAPSPYPPADVIDTRQRLEAVGPFFAPFGVDVEAATANGYEIAARLAPPTEDPEAADRTIVDRLTETERQAWERAFSGDGSEFVEVELPDGSRVGQSTGGCLGDALRTLYGDPQTYLEARLPVDNARSRVEQQASSDAAFVSAEARWAECMRDLGVDVRSRRDAIAMATAAYDSPASAAGFAAESRIAAADAECSATTGYAEAAADAWARARQDVLADLEGQLLAYDETPRAALDVARGVLAEG